MINTLKLSNLLFNKILIGYMYIYIFYDLTRDVTITGLTINHDSPQLVLPFHILIIIKTVFNYHDLNNSR